MYFRYLGVDSDSVTYFQFSCEGDNFFEHINWLVVCFNPSEKYAQVNMGSSSPNFRGEN